MKRLMHFAICLALTTLLLPLKSYAQENKGERMRKHTENITLEERADFQTIRMQEFLVLSDEQTERVGEINLKYAKKEASKTQSVNGKYQFVFKDAIVTVHGYKWIESLQVQTAKVDLNEIKTIEGVIYPKGGFKLISLQCSFEPRTLGDVKFNNIRINLYTNELQSNLVCWYLSFGSSSGPMKIAMNTISKGACQSLKPVVVFVVPNSASVNNISVGTNSDEARPIFNLRNLKTEKI